MKTPIDSHTLKVLEFDKITNFLVQFAITESGKRFCQRIAPQTTPSLIQERLREVSEMKSIITTYGLLPFNCLKDLTRFLEKAETEGSVLFPLELWDVLTLLESSRQVKSFINQVKEEASTLRVLADKIKVIITLEKKLSVSIDSNGEILDSANKELERIRINAIQVRKQIKSVLEDIFKKHDYAYFVREKLITLRHERYVIPVKAEFKTRIPGVVHDQSHNQATFFIEPFKVVELNNELTLLKDEEKREELRILKDLTNFVRSEKETLFNNQRYLGILDSIQARARMSEEMKSQEPELGKEKEIKLLQARHPILLYHPPPAEDHGYLPRFNNSKVISIDILFPSEYSGMIITGANMGGKTAALKTLGLLNLMVQAGMHIPVNEGSRLPVWEKIFADIGDEQNLEESVSTFSSHINQQNKILDQADEKSLVLLDEVGAGTDPQEGGALELAIIDELRTRRTKIALTSHLNLLKAYAVSLPDVINVSVEFDPISLKPTFKLLYGVPGTSKALETAARLGTDSKILTKAKTYLQEYNLKIIELIEYLEHTLKSLNATKEVVEKTLLSASQYENTVQKLAKKIEAQKGAIFAQLESKARFLFCEAESELKKAMKYSTPSQHKGIKEIKEKINSIKNKIRKNLPHSKSSINTLETLKKGDRISLGKSKKEGKIIEIDHLSDKVEIQAGGLRLKTNIDELAWMESDQIDPKQKLESEPPEIKVTSPGPSGSSTSLNLIGLTIDEAIPLVEKFIDNALLYGVKELRIIHGLGTGRLRQAIHKYLKQNPEIKSFYPGAPLEGGAGLTIIELDS